MKKTPLYDVYKDYGAKVVDFHGWGMPVQFSKIQEEHEAVRHRAGLFDVSHMGELTVKGEDALALLQKVATNNIAKLKTGAAQYTAMCYENGGTVDDLLIYKRADNGYLMIPNASNVAKDYEWISSHAQGDVNIENVSEKIGQLAIQGPEAESILQTLTDTDLSTIKFFKFQENVVIQGVSALVSRTGYTGEDGFEMYCKAQDVVVLWKAIMKAGENKGLLPCGLGARDTLRFEAHLLLYGQDLTPDITPIEAGIGFAVKVNKDEDFIGKTILQRQKQEGVSRKLVGLEMIDQGIPRPDYEVFAGEKKIGWITTGTQSPTLKKNIGLALLQRPYTELGTEVDVQVRKRRLRAKVAKTPFYSRG